MENHILVVDIETTSKELNDAKVVIFGAYDPHLDKYFIYKWNDETLAKAVKLFSQYDYIMSFGGKRYDIPILKRHGLINPKKQLDIYEIISRSRKTLLPQLDSYSLDSATSRLLGKSIKGTIDYELFKKDTWTKKEKAEIIDYCKRDLRATWELWQYLEQRFKIFGEYLSEKDRLRYKHIVAPLPTYVYKIICYGAGIPELYDENPKIKEFPKPIITQPKKQFVLGPIALLTFPYLYPHILIQFNLLSWNCTCCHPDRVEGKFHGKNFYRIKGYYCQKTHGAVESFLKKLYVASLNDPTLRTLVFVVFNNLYNIITNATYYTLYNPYAARDLVSLARQQLSIVLKRFRDKGYFVVYLEVDKLFVKIDESKGQTFEEAQAIADGVVELLKTKMTFPSETFKLTIVDKLRYIQFYRGPHTIAMVKKKYLFIDYNGRVESKGLTTAEIEETLSKVGVTV